VKASPSALAVALALIEARVYRMLSISTYGELSGRTVDLHMCVRELQEAERTAAAQPERTQ